VFQTGAWILPDERPLSPELKKFLETGEPPVFFGFGSMRAPLRPEVAGRAKSVATAVRRDGAEIAARRVMEFNSR
jgi:vancomycin aglycone glucosyltransferase